MQISSLNIQQLIDQQQLIQNIAEYRKGERIEASKYDLCVGRVFRSKGLYPVSLIGVNERQIQEMVAIEPMPLIFRHVSWNNMGWPLESGVYFLQSAEIVNMPPWLSALIVSRTSIFRAGCLLTGSVIDPGFSGNILVRLEVPETYTLMLEQGAKVMSLIFQTIGTLENVSPGELDELKFINSLIANERYTGIWTGDRVSTQGEVERGS